MERLIVMVQPSNLPKVTHSKMPAVVGSTIILYVTKKGKTPRSH